MSMMLDINSRSKNNLERQLSNFAKHGPFKFDGKECLSIEGPLQGCKTSLPMFQQRIYQMPPLESHRLYKSALDSDWRRNLNLYRGDMRFNRCAREHHEFVTDVFDACFQQSQSYRDAIEASIGYELQHTLGKYDFTKTVLTIPEFLGQVYRLQTSFLQ